MNSDFSFKHLSTADKWLFVGNIATTLGFMAIAIGTTYRLAAQGGLPSGRPAGGPVQGDIAGTVSHTSPANKARDYFS